jgi:hypothetical protein
VRAIALLLIAAACGSHPRDSVHGSWKGPAALAYVPADTPYVLATLDPMTDDVQEYMFGNVARPTCSTSRRAPTRRSRS